MARTENTQNEMPEWIPRATFTVIGIILSVIAAFWILQRLGDLVAWVIISLFLSFALEPLTNRLERRGWKRGTATGLIIFGSLVLFVVFVGSMVPLIVSQARELIESAPRFVNQISNFAFDRFGLELSTQDLIARLTNIGSTFGVNGGNVASNVLGIGGRLFGGVLQLFTIALLTFYLVVDGPKVRRKSMALMPAKQQKLFLETWEIAIEKMGGYLYVRLILAGLSALTAFIIMTVARVPYALPLALWMGLISQFIPVVGTYIAAAVPITVALLENPWSALVIVVYVVLYQQVENFMISPKLTAHTMQLHPAIAITAALAGGTLYGAIGAFLALPAAAIVQVVIGSYFRRHDVIEDDGYLLGIQNRIQKKTKT